MAIEDETPKGGPADETLEANPDGKQPLGEPFRLPIEDVLDLHAFAPKEVPSVVEEYLEQCRQAGISEVRLIHGKGTGAQRAVVQRLLRNHPDVVSFVDAPPQTGGWGATLVRLKPPAS
jgi:DNA-nicking Smr family endonuclease